MDVTFLQTCDPVNYVRMMAATSKTVIAYTQSQGHRYESYTGIKRGYFPWHSTFNRCYMLAELMERGFTGWAAYLDADAYIADRHFDLNAFLSQHRGRAAIMAISEDNDRVWWDVNAGVVLLNFAHPLARMIVRRWRDMVDAVPDDRLRAANVFSRDGFDDQIFLQAILRSAPELEPAIFNPPTLLINSPKASFIRQFLRAADADLERRTRRIERDVAEVLGTVEPSLADQEAHEARRMVDSLYQAILRRPADPSGMSSFTPYILDMGPIDGAGFLATRLIDSDEFRALPDPTGA